MTTFLRLLTEPDKASALTESCARVRQGVTEMRCFDVAPKAFDAVPGKPFAYWLTNGQLNAFENFRTFERSGYIACVTNQLGDDFRFYRAWWEISPLVSDHNPWIPLAKGGQFSAYYSDVHLLVKWNTRRGTYLGFIGTEHRPLEKPASSDYFLRFGLTWPRRTQNFGVRVLPSGCIFSNKGPGVFTSKDDVSSLLMLVGLMNSLAFKSLLSARLNAGDSTARSFEVGIVQETPLPEVPTDLAVHVSALSQSAWSLKRTIDSSVETSHAFLLPALLRARLDGYDASGVEAQLGRVQNEIDEIAFDLYGFSDSDRAAALGVVSAGAGVDDPSEDGEGNEDESVDDAPSSDALMSWAVGVAFGRFDWRLATGEHSAPPEPEPFDPLPTKSPGMLPDGATPFHQHVGILVDDQGHPHDLARLVEQVLETVDVPVAEDVRRWLQKDFFTFHLKRYSKSRRKAPIYLPLATASGSYTLWLYYPSLSNQTLFSAVNDFLDPKLENVRKELQTLRDKGAGRSKQDEKSLEALASLEHELADLRDSLLEIAPNYRPNHDDGVQITDAPLWKLFRHKPWQKVLKDTWAKLEKGDYDWAHVAMNYWPDRVRDKCVTDKSLAIAHGLEHLYVEPEPVEKKTRGRKKAGSTE